jgi:putative transposase
MPFSNRLLNLFAEVAHSDLKRQIEFLKIENTILRKKCLHQRIILDDRDRHKLLKYGLPLGGQIKHLISIVHYSTFRGWVQRINQPHRQDHRRGRPSVITPKIKLLIVTMAKQNQWGYTKILAELKKLKVKRVSRTSVRNILKEYGIDHFKIRAQDTWDQFLKRTFDTLWACDFFSKYVWTPFGRRMYHCLFFINIKTRQVHVAGITKRVDRSWLIEQIQKMESVFHIRGCKAAIVRDKDIKYFKGFDEFFEQRDIKIMKIPYRSPNLNPYAESWVATIKRECLDHFLVIGKVHLEYLVKEFLDYYNQYRPHSSMNNGPLTKGIVKTDGEDLAEGGDEIHAKPILGGLIHHYYRN